MCAMSTPEDFDVIQFEKRLTGLKDSQDAINICCRWCLDNRQHHKKIVLCWLNVLKRVKIEQRLNLFYLANDVIQYSKRKHFEFVESWGTALQKATTLVRDDKVKHKIVRIFNIWQQRGVYNEEFISDLCGLISVVPTASKSDESHEFQSSYVTNKIKQCSKLETETDMKLKVLKEHNPKIQLETETLCVSLKDRAHVDDVEKELETYVKHLEGYINALKAEIKCRITNISVLKTANSNLDKDKKDVKVVANAYKVFGNKVKVFQKKLEEHKVTLSSPVPSPDINAPSPSPDCDIELPEDDNEMKINTPITDYNPNMTFSAGYYNPVPPPSTESSNFVSNGYASFIGSTFSVEGMFPNAQSTANNNILPEVNNSNYGLNNADLSSVLQSIAQPPPPPEAPREPFSYSGTTHLPLLPPPMPPFGDGGFNQSYDGNNSYGHLGEEYNPEQEPDTWETDSSWGPLEPDTPESPPNFEKEGYVEGIEYHDSVANSGASDVDHRMLHPIRNKLDAIRGRGKDVDHRNLISLTGSPADNSSSVSPELWNNAVDQDYRTMHDASPRMDQDYRLPPFNLENLKLPPPPPPPHSHNKESRKLQDNVESIDMELSEDEVEEHRQMNNDGLTSSLEPPPPLPDLPDDVDANSFLDDLDNDLNSNEFTASLHDPYPHEMGGPPPPMGFNPNSMPPPPMMGPPPNNWPGKQQQSPHNNNSFGFRGRGAGGNRGQAVYHRGMNRGRGRGNFGFRGGNNFRSRGRGRASRPHFPRGNMRGNFQGGF